MPYKILISDIDGTLLSDHNNVSDFTTEQIARIKDAVKVILASARMPSAIRYLQERLGVTDMPMICYNGGLVIQGEITLSSSEIPLDKVKRVVETAKEHDISLGIYSYDDWFADKMTHRVAYEIDNTQVKPRFRSLEKTIATLEAQHKGAHKIMSIGGKEETDILERMLREDLENQMAIYRSNDIIMEITDNRVSKFAAVKLLLDSFGLSEHEAIAFGDNYNDLEMIENVGHGVAMENGREVVKEIADAIAGHHTKDGVAYYLQKVFS